ncbi:hypothetical protein [Ruminococcus albus]|uniref:hypothetical protein n=1 Tax=Ruminococcus albus TaxID=1264 RepID=UPI003AF36105
MFCLSDNVLNNFRECYELLSNVYDQVNGEDFYRYIFPDNENSGELSSDFSHPNAIYLYHDEQDEGAKRRLRRRIMLNDTWASDYMDYVEGNGMTLCSGLTYHSRSNKLQYAQTMNALIFDLDGVGRSELEHVLERTTGSGDVYRSIPKPTFIVLSGRGLHLYYVFDEPIALYPNIKLQLKSLKHDLTFRIWEYKGTSQVESIQYQSIGQGFRMVGSTNSKYGNTVTAFKIGGKVSLDFLNSYAIKPENRVDVNRPYRPSKIDRATAAELYPEWYQKVVVEGNKRPNKWNIGYRKKKQVKDYALYEWWKRRVTEIEGGHRYFYLMCLVIYACKCDVPKKQLKVDIQACFEVLRAYKHNNELTQDDVDSAMECYSKDYYNFTIADIEILTDVRIERNKRNYQKQEWHLEDIRSKKANMKRRGQPFRNAEGRPSKQQIVLEWQQLHPMGRKVDCIRDTGLSKPTVLKWWRKEFEA